MKENLKELPEEVESLEQIGSLRRKELLSIPYERLSEEEKGELIRLIKFLNNLRVAELRKKEASGLITDDEKDELEILDQLSSINEKSSPAIKQLWERTKANDPYVEQVSMSDGKVVEVGPTEEAEKIIWTFALAGCVGAVVFTENEGGARNCVLTHYPPTELSINMKKLRELISRSEKMKTAKNKQVILFIPGEWTIDEKTKKWEIKIKNHPAINALSLAIRAELGADVEIKLEQYSRDVLMGQKDQGTLVVYVPPVGKGDAYYKTWFSSEKLSADAEKQKNVAENI